MNRLALIALAAVFSIPALAAPVTYTIDPNHTYPAFSYTHLGFSKQTQRFNSASGKVVLDAAAHTASVEVVIDMNSVDSASAKFIEHLKSPDFFDTAKFPTATFHSTKVTFAGDQAASVEGELTMMGVTRPVTLQVTHFQAMPHPMMKKDYLGANATTVVKRSDFGLTKYVPYVSDEVTIDIAIEAVNQ
jgi:polyisoprenoid-binding protein YceI